MLETRGALPGNVDDADRPAPNRFSPLYREVRQVMGKTVRSVWSTTFAPLR